MLAVMAWTLLALRCPATLFHETRLLLFCTLCMRADTALLSPGPALHTHG